MRFLQAKQAISGTLFSLFPFAPGKLSDDKQIFLLEAKGWGVGRAGGPVLVDRSK